MIAKFTTFTEQVVQKMCKNLLRQLCACKLAVHCFKYLVRSKLASFKHKRNNSDCLHCRILTYNKTLAESLVSEP
jgi:hypothetical protein